MTVVERHSLLRRETTNTTTTTTTTNPASHSASQPATSEAVFALSVSQAHSLHYKRYT